MPSDRRAATPGPPTRTGTPRARSARPGRRPNRQLRGLLAESGWTQEAVARSLTALGAETGLQLHYDRTSVAQWLRGSRPAPQVRRLLAEALSRRLGRPITPADLGMGDHPRQLPPPRGPSGPADQVAALTSPVVAPPRNAAPPAAPYQLTLLPGQGTTGLPPETAGSTPTARPATTRTGAPRAQPATASRPFGPLRRSVPAPAGSTRAARRTGPDEVASVREHVRFFAQQADRHGGGHIRTPLAACLSDLVSGLRGGPGGPQHPQLLSGAARLSYLLGRVYADERHHGLAQRAFLTAAELAEQGGDLAGVALARRVLSTQAHQLGHHAHSRALAESACAAAPGSTPPGTRAFLYAGLALARAGSGERAGALESLGRAERELARVPADLTTGPESPGGEPAGSYPHAALLYQSGQVRAGLGDHAGAVTDLRTSLSLRPAGERRSRALSHAGLAELLLHCGRLEEACAAWRVFLEDCSLVRSGRVRHARDRMPQLLRPYAHEPCAAELLLRTGEVTRSGVR